MELLQLQQRFTRLLADLIVFAYERGYEITLGELYRPKEMAQYYARKGKGIADSLHTLRLAVDINLFKDDKYLTDSEAYKELGEFWESLDSPGFECCWGGRFKDSKGKPKPDGNHFSIGYAGKK
jgi:hypothetical protein